MAKLLDFTGIKSRQVKWLPAAWLWLCLLLGGASQGGMLANLVLQLGAAALLAYAIWRGAHLRLQAEEQVPFYVMIAALAWIAIMFIPLPPFIWQMLPGRSFIAEGYGLLGIELPWLSMALAPDRALRSVLMLLAPLMAWLIARRLDQARRRQVLGGAVVIAAISAGWGLAQMSTGPESILRFYSPTNREFPVGFFANTNHFSVFLASSLPLAAAWIAARDPKRRPKRQHLIGFAILAALIALVLIIGRSVAGLAFLILAGIGSAHILFGRFVAGGTRKLFLFGVVFAAILSIGSLAAIGTGTIGAKFDDAPTSRSNMTPVTIQAGNSMAPTGSGLGSFAQVYAMHQPDQFTSTTWVNHAHNDYVEIYLELGIMGVILVAIFLFWFVRQGFAIWQSRLDPHMLIPQAAWMVAALLLLHSIVDYPLRTAALAALFATCIALMLRLPEDRSDSMNG